MKNTTTNDDLLTIDANASQTDDAQVGDRVRTFDWDRGTECVEGIVTAIDRLNDSAACYEIKIDREWRPINDTERDAPSKVYTGENCRIGQKVSRFVDRSRDYLAGFVNLSKDGEGDEVAPHPVHAFRDALGRFTVGNPGRAILSLAA